MSLTLLETGPSFATGCAVVSALLLSVASLALRARATRSESKSKLASAQTTGPIKRDVETGPPTPPGVTPALSTATNIPPVALTPTPAPKETKPYKWTEADQIYDLRLGWIAPPAPPKAVGDSDDLFIAYSRSFNAQSSDESFVWLELKNAALLESIKPFFPSSASLYETKAGIDARDIYIKMRTLRGATSDMSEQDKLRLTTLLDFVQTKYVQTEEQVRAMPQGRISWRLLWTLFEAGSDIEASHESSSEPISLTLDSWSYGSDAQGRAFILKCHFHQWTGVSFQRVNTTRKITEYNDLMLIKDLAAGPLTASRKALLTERGRKYMKFASQCHAEYNGPFVTRAFAGVVKLPGKGQAIVDVKGFRKVNPTLDMWNDDPHGSSNSDFKVVQQQGAATFDPELYHLLPPTIHGFSLPNKKWGEFLIAHLENIDWLGKRSFDHLVIPDSYRSVIQALVDVHSGALKEKLISDVVEGKGSGLIIALHGKPGTGKTLTAEAVADHLKRPLYAVSAGELGMNPTNLERQLRDILELATSWRAVLLIDEADVFLEKRNSTQLDRNALVGVFLRLLEYFQGVLILTTNHIDHFDEAFASRFSISLAFDDLNQASRRTLWQRFLSMVYPGKTLEQLEAIFDLDEVSRPALNGRVIKQKVRTAQALALFEGAELTMDHLRTVINFD